MKESVFSSPRLFLEHALGGCRGDGGECLLSIPSGLGAMPQLPRSWTGTTVAVVISSSSVAWSRTKCPLHPALCRMPRDAQCEVNEEALETPRYQSQAGHCCPVLFLILRATQC